MSVQQVRDLRAVNITYEASRWPKELYASICFCHNENVAACGECQNKALNRNGDLTLNFSSSIKTVAKYGWHSVGLTWGWRGQDFLNGASLGRRMRLELRESTIIA